MLVYRLEDAFGLGYKGRRYDDSYPDLDSLSQCHKNYFTSSWSCDKSRPVPWADNIPKVFLKREGWYFGFYTEHQIVRYFSPHDLFVMGEFGGVIVTYEVDDKHVWKGDHQCVFFKRRAVIVDSKNCREYSYIKEYGDWIDYEDLEDSREMFESFKKLK
jgi:hypothetical protein